MNIHLKQLGLLLAAGNLYFCGIAGAADVIYAQGFANNTGAGTTLVHYGWALYVDTGASDFSASANRIVTNMNGPGITNVNAAAPFGNCISTGFYNGNSDKVALAYVPFPPGHYKDITVKADIRNSSNDAEMRFAFEIGGNWYVSNDIFKWNHASTFTTVTITLTPATELASLNFTPGPGGSLVVDSGSAISFSSISGEVTKTGFFHNPKATTQMRVDNFIIEATQSVSPGIKLYLILSN